ncbi:hypothetical protein HPP92_003112 [Vanilla planifolia]|uniref:Uncharacterized protein n=1 Tax=Vanilla planifolia TaxID=51239 RepID=A0A835S1M0_VANPL|nr:hypothetical protein HPP92_003112 [Vanilla planifolia]
MASGAGENRGRDWEGTDQCGAARAQASSRMVSYAAASERGVRSREEFASFDEEVGGGGIPKQIAKGEELGWPASNGG